METQRLPTRILLIEEDGENFLFVRNLLSEISTQRFRLEWLTDCDAALDAVACGSFDLCLLGDLVGQRSGRDLLREISKSSCRVPVILLTGHGDYQVDMEAMKTGAADYLTKGELTPDLLERSIRYSIERAKAREALQKFCDDLQARVLERTEELSGANEALSLSMERLRLALDAARAGTWEWNLKTDEVFWSEELWHLYGLAPHSCKPSYKAWRKTIHPHDRERTERAVKDAVRNSTRFVAEWHVSHGDGTGHWLMSCGGPLHDAHGRPVRYSGIVLDITEHKRNEERAHRYELLASHSRDIFLLVQRDSGRILEANDAATKAYGYSLEELLTLTLHDLREPEARKMIAEQMAEADRRGILFETVHRRKDGSTFPVEVNSRTATIGGANYLVSVVRDITARKHAEKMLQKSEERYRLLFESGMDANLLTAPGGEIFAVNPAACEMFGWSEEEIKRLGRNGIVDTSDPRLKSAIEERARTGRFRGELTLMRSDGSTFPGEVSSIIFGEDGVHLTNTVIRDITERKAMEDTLRKAHDQLDLKVRELKDKSERLEEVNIALRVLLNQREEDKKELGESVLSNIRNLILPYIQRLKKSQLSYTQRVLVEILESHLTDVASSFSRKLGLQYADLTSTEVRVAVFIREGRSTDEIAEILCLSRKTVESHRANIRRKLGLRGGRSNLRSYLLGLT